MYFFLFLMKYTWANAKCRLLLLVHHIQSFSWLIALIAPQSILIQARSQHLRLGGSFGAKADLFGGSGRKIWKKCGPEPSLGGSSDPSDPALIGYGPVIVLSNGTNENFSQVYAPMLVKNVIHHVLRKFYRCRMVSNQTGCNISEYSGLISLWYCEKPVHRTLFMPWCTWP